MEHLKRFLAILGSFSISMVVIHTTRAPQRLPHQGYRVACMPLTNANSQNADTQLIPYAQIAHTTVENDVQASPAYRCYFRFAPRDVICTPKYRKKIKSCPIFPTISGSQKKKCYILNSKLTPLTNLLSKKPAVSMHSYLPNQTGIVEKWQQVRDILLGK